MMFSSNNGRILGFSIGFSSMVFFRVLDSGTVGVLISGTVLDSGTVTLVVVVIGIPSEIWGVRGVFYMVFFYGILPGTGFLYRWGTRFLYRTGFLYRT